MDRKSTVGVRNWEFLNHAGHTSSLMKSASAGSISNNGNGNQPAFLKMSTYTNRNIMIGESNSHVSAMDFPWNPHKSFLSQSKNTAILHSAEVGSELIHMPEAPENASHGNKTETKSLKLRKEHPSPRGAGHIAKKAPRCKDSQKAAKASVPRKKKEKSVSVGKREKKNYNEVADGVVLDLASIPVPVCSCTGVARQCYRWGAGGWQSSCCTTNISEYPLPMNSSRPGARLAGRKMSIGAYGKLLQRLAAERHDLSFAVDLKNHWARHGTNKFVTIR